MKALFAILSAVAVFTASGFAQSSQITQTGAGTTVAKSATAPLAFHGATPVAQRAGSAQAAVTTTVGAAVASTSATNSTPYGFSQTQANDLVARVNQLRADILALTTLVNELRAANVEKGLIKGAP